MSFLWLKRSNTVLYETVNNYIVMNIVYKIYKVCIIILM